MDMFEDIRKWLKVNEDSEKWTIFYDKKRNYYVLSIRGGLVLDEVEVPNGVWEVRVGERTKIKMLELPKSTTNVVMGVGALINMLMVERTKGKVFYEKEKQSDASRLCIYSNDNINGSNIDQLVYNGYSARDNSLILTNCSIGHLSIKVGRKVKICLRETCFVKEIDCGMADEVVIQHICEDFSRQAFIGDITGSLKCSLQVGDDTQMMLRVGKIDTFEWVTIKKSGMEINQGHLHIDEIIEVLKEVKVTEGYGEITISCIMSCPRFDISKAPNCFVGYAYCVKEVVGGWKMLGDFWQVD